MASGQVQVGLPLRAWRVLKKCRISTPSRKISAAISQFHCGGEGQRIVDRQHEEDDRQRQVVVVQAALLGDLAVLGVGHAAGLQVGDDDLLVGDDDHRDVRRHDGGGEGAHVQHRGAAGEHLRIGPAHRREDGEQHHHQPGGRVADGRLAERVVEHPAERDRADRDQDAGPVGDVEHVPVDEEEVGADVIDHGQQREAAKAR